MSNNPESFKIKPGFVLIGAGRLGSMLSLKLSNENIRPVQVISRSLVKAKKLAEQCKCENYSDKLKDLVSSDFIIISVNDDSILEILETLPSLITPVFHTSGSTSVSVFGKKFPNHGVLYPLQSFTPGRELDFSEIPLLIEASNENTANLLSEIAGHLSNTVLSYNSEQRLKAHIAAVFSSNFTNHFLILARDYLTENGLDPGILDPLIKETFMKVIEMGRKNIQTGPAARGDRGILQLHEEILKINPSLQKIYTFVSENIIKVNKDKERN